MAEIGRVGPSRREVSGINPSVNPQAFGAGVAQALGTMGQELAGLAQTQVQREVANTSLSEAYKARQDKLESARLRADLIRLDNEMSRGLSERYDAAPPGAPNFTNESQAWVQSQLEDFRRRIPDRLLPNFEAELASISEGKTNAAFRLQVSAENAEFTKMIGDLQSQATEQMLTAVITRPEELDALEAQWVEDLTEIMADSPMDAQATRELAEGISIAISSAKMTRLATEEAIDNVSSGIGAIPGQIKVEGSRVYSDRPVAAGLSRAAVGFLQAIAGPESGGDYNVMYSPDGRRYFDDFSWHPNQSAVIASGPNAGKTSSAAGRYQFLYSTWVGAVEELKAKGVEITDFSPASQDVVAWHIAQRDFAARTGRDLTTVLESGNQPAILAAKQVLTATWEGLGNNDPRANAAFVNAISSATGNPSALLFDEEFSHIPLDQRFAIIADGQAQAQAMRTQMAAEAKAQRESMIAEVNQMLFEGTGGMREIEMLKSRLNLSVDEQESLLKTYRDNQTQRYESERIMQSLDDPLFIFDQTSTEHKSMAGSFFAQTRVGERLAEGDEAYVNSLMIPMVKASNGFVPANVVGVLTQQMASQNPQQAAFAFTTAAKLMVTNDVAFKDAFGDKMAAQVVAYNYAQSSLPQEELLRYIREQASPEAAARREFADQIYKDARRDRPEDFSVQEIARQLGASDGIHPAAGTALFSEFYGAYQYQLGIHGDHKTAYDAAIKLTSMNYGPTRVGGRERLMKHPPERQPGMAFDGGYEWMEQQLLEEFPGLAGQKFELNSDPMTDAQKAAGQPPSYTITIYDENDMPVKRATMADHINGRNENSFRTARWYPQITEQMKIDLYNREKETAPTIPMISPGTEVLPPLPSLAGAMERVEILGRQVNKEIADVILPDNPRIEGGPTTYNEWRKLSSSEKKRLGLDMTRLDAIRYFGSFGTNLEDE